MKKPNVVFIITDQQRFDSLGSTGNPYAVTPNLDKLVADSTLFTRYITNSAICCPSRASVLTGLYSSTHGLWTNGCILPREDYTKVTEGSKRAFPNKWIASHVPTFADAFKENGYNTIEVGKMHLTPVDAEKGFGYKESSQLWKENPEEMNNWHGNYYGFDDVNLTIGHGEFIGGHYGVWLEKNHPEVMKKVQASKETRTLEFPEHWDIYPSEMPEEYHNTTWITDVACQKIDEYKDNENPFLMWVGYPDPHSPFVPPKALAEEFSTHDVLDVDVPYEEWESKPFAFRNLMNKRNAKNTKPEAIKRAKQYTDALMYMIDKGVGKIVETLKEKGLYEDTIIVFTSDHGDFLGDYGMLGKCVPCCKSLNHVPLIIKAPENTFPKQVANTVSSVDLAPTLFDLTGIDNDYLIQGESISTVLENGRTKPTMVQHYTPNELRHNLSIYDDRFRYTWYPQTDEFELYDHQNDPKELKNLAYLPEWKTERDRLHMSLMASECKYSIPRAGRIAAW